MNFSNPFSRFSQSFRTASGRADRNPHTFPVAKLKKLHRISVAEKSLCRKRVASAAVQQEMSAEQPFSSRSGVVLLEDKGASAWMCRSPQLVKKVLFLRVRHPVTAPTPTPPRGEGLCLEGTAYPPPAKGQSPLNLLKFFDRLGASAWMCRSPDFNDISYFPQQQAGHSVHFQDDRHDP